jgi:hypothetical protein
MPRLAQIGSDEDAQIGLDWPQIGSDEDAQMTQMNEDAKMTQMNEDAQ